MSSTKFVFFGPIGKTRWPPWPLIGWDIFDFSAETTERNSTKLDRKQDLNVLYQVCVFQANQKNKMAVLASDWLRDFWLLLWNFLMEFNETWQEARSQRPLPSLCFSGRSKKEDGRPGLWLAETFSTSPLKLQNRIQRNLTGSKITTSSTKFVFFRPISKQKCSPWLIPQKGGRLYSGARYMALWASCFNAFLLEKFYIKIAFLNVHDGRIVHRLRCSGIFSYYKLFCHWENQHMPDEVFMVTRRPISSLQLIILNTTTFSFMCHDSSCDFVGLLHHPLWFTLFYIVFGCTFKTFTIIPLA